MNEKYNVYPVSDSTGETLDRIFLSLKSQFSNFEYDKKEFAFVRKEHQINKIIDECSKIQNSIILYTIVETKLAKYIANVSQKKNVPCFGILGNLILSFSKLLNQKAIHKPSAQHVLDDDYYNRIEAIQFTMSHADIRRNRVAIMKENNIKEYTDIKFISEEVNKSKLLFKKYNWPIIDVTRKSVEETAASILKILEIQKNK